MPQKKLTNAVATINKLKCKLSREMLGNSGDLSLTIDKLRKELASATSPQQMELDKDILQQKYDNLVESTQTDISLNESLHKEHGGFNLGDIDSTSAKPKRG